MSPVAKIIHFKASKEYLSGSVSLDPALAIISQQPGAIRSYVGYETEDSTNVFWVNEWESRQAREEFSKRPIHQELQALARPALDSEPLSARYVAFEETKAFGAPITEFVTFKVYKPEDTAKLESLIEQIHQEFKKVDFHGDCWAPVIDEVGLYHGILGWDSVEAHWEVVVKEPLKGLIEQVKDIADLRLVHAALKPYSG